MRISLCAPGCTITLILAVTLAGVGWSGPGETPAPASTQSQAQVPSLDCVLEKLESVRKDFVSCTARVTKERTVVPLQDTEVFDGTLQFKSPRMVRMELRSRETGEQTVYIVGKEYAWTYRPADKQAEGIPLRSLGERAKRGNPIEYGLASSVDDLRKSYDLEIVGSEHVADRDTVILSMRPKGSPRDVQDGTVTLWLCTTTWLPVRIREVKNDGDVIETYTFFDVATGGTIPDAAFEFVPGKDVDVIVHQTD